MTVLTIPECDRRLLTVGLVELALRAHPPSSAATVTPARRAELLCSVGALAGGLYGWLTRESDDA